MIEFSHIEKSFFGVKVLKDVSFVVKHGQTVGIVGENGAGKSTLMNILGGNLRADGGLMRLNAAPYAPASPGDAERAGIAFIHQELNLFANLSIAENLFLRGFPRSRTWLPFINRRQMSERTRELLREVDLAHSPDTLVERLSAGERQLVEIAKALALDARLIILDEPTTSLTARESERLFAIMARLRTRGLSMIYISHSLGHVLKLSDLIVVLRDGAVVANEPTKQFTMDRLVSLMVGREITQLFPVREPKLRSQIDAEIGLGIPSPHDGGVGREPGRGVSQFTHEVTKATSSPQPSPPAEGGEGTRAPATDVVLDVRGVSQPGVVRDITFQLHRGEILGVSGLMGAGRSELARILFGLDPCAAGDIRLNNESISQLPASERIRRGLAFLTEDRRAEGLCLEASIADNVTLAALRDLTRPAVGWLDRPKANAEVNRMREAVKLTTAARNEQPVKTLSGGNQQKVVLAKWLLNEPKVFILDEPTRGIDVGAKYEIYRLIHELAARGAGVLMISSEVEELIGMCDRIIVMRRGRIHDTVTPQEFDRERILRSALHDGALA